MVKAAQLEDDEKGPGMMGLIRELLRPYRGSLIIILVAIVALILIFPQRPASKTH